VRRRQASDQDGYAGSEEPIAENIFYDNRLNAYRIHALPPIDIAARGFRALV
jgi:hypothetical protein